MAKDMKKKEYKIGQLVWAKMKGYPYWPARVIDPEDSLVANIKRGRNKRSVNLVTFFGSGDHAFISTDDLQPYFARRKKFSQHSKQDNFIRSLQAVKTYIEEHPDVKQFEKDPHLNDDANAREFRLETTYDDSARDDSEDTDGSFPKRFKRSSLSVQIPIKTSSSVLHAEQSATSGLEQNVANGSLTAKMSASSTALSDFPRRSIKLTPPTKKFGFIGLGNLGSILAKRLLAHDHQLLFCDKNEKSSDFASARFVESPSDLIEECDIIFSCVSDNNAVHEVVFGEHGIVAGRLGPGKAYVEFSTMDIQTALEVQEAITETGARYLEAPMTGTTKDANEGKMIFTCSGDKSVFEDLCSTFSALGRRALYLGSGCSGTKVRLCLQTLFGSVTACVAETLALADRCALNISDFKEIVEMTNFNSHFFQEISKTMIDGVFLPPEMRLGLMQTEIQHGVDLASQLSQPMLLGSLVNQIFIAAKNKGEESCDSAAVFRYFQESSSNKV